MSNLNNKHKFRCLHNVSSVSTYFAERKRERENVMVNVKHDLEYRVMHPAMVRFLFYGYKHTKRQASSGSFEVLTLAMTLGNGSGTHFGASQCIPMGLAT